MSQTLSLALKKKPSALSKTAFMEIYGGIYENSPWVAQELWKTVPSTEIDTVQGFACAAQSIVDRASTDIKFRLIRAHPDLAGRAAAAKGLTSSSTQEQTSAGLDQCSPEELELFQTLNAAYKARFGFPFIMAVQNRDRAEILEAFSQRLQNAPEQEFLAAMTEIHQIAYLRLTALSTRPTTLCV